MGPFQVFVRNFFEFELKTPLFSELIRSWSGGDVFTLRELQQKVDIEVLSSTESAHSPIPSKPSLESLLQSPLLPRSVLCYLEPTRLSLTEHGLILEVPTQFHLMMLKKHETQLQEILKAENFKIEVKEMQASAAPESSKVQSIAEYKTRPTPVPVSQVRLPLPPRMSEQGALDLEKSRRLPVPHFTLSPQFQMPFELSKRWADAVNKSGGQVLWIYGKSGSGKTHLLKQLHEWIALKKRIVHLDAMQFFHEWRRALDSKDTIGFVRKYRRETDLLVLENIDLLENKLKTQEEILITVNALMERGASVAVSSVRSPSSLKGSIEPALYSRLFGGMIVEMPVPDRSFKENLWRLLMEQNGLKDFPVELVIVERIFNIPVDTARGVHALLVNAIANLSLRGSLGSKEASDLEGRFTPQEGPKMGLQSSPAEYVDKISRLCGLGMAAIQSNSRRSQTTLARKFVCLALCRFLGMTNSAIAVLVNKDASTVSKALQAIEEEICTDRHISGQWAYICQQLGVSPTFERSHNN